MQPKRWWIPGRAGGLSMELKVRFLRATVFSIASYGCESWAMTKNDRKRIDAFKMWCYILLLRVSWKDKNTNEWVLAKIRSDLMFWNNIESRKLWYFGHIGRKQRNIDKDILQGMIEGRRGRGDPPTARTDNIRYHTGLSMVATIWLADYRARWRTLVKATAVPMGAIWLREKERDIQALFGSINAMFWIVHCYT